VEPSILLAMFSLTLFSLKAATMNKSVSELIEVSELNLFLEGILRGFYEVGQK
jgi:hypothetical protein